MSQLDKLFLLLQDHKPHSTVEICEKVYGSEHLGLARVGARIWDLKKRYGLKIESWRDKNKKTIWWYCLISKNKISDNITDNYSEIQLPSFQKQPEQKQLFKIKFID